SPAYNGPSALRLIGALDEVALEQSLNALVHRHETLRTTFSLSEGIPCQVIHTYSPFQIPIVDLSGMEEGEREAEAQRLIETEARQPFDLEQGPMLRVRLLRLGTEEHILLLTLHHIVIDGWS